jgi:hypothetical protein
VNKEATSISHLKLDFDIGIPMGVDAESSLDTALHLDTTGAGKNGYINGVWVNGHWRYVRTGVLQTGVTGEYNQQSRNTFRVQIQSSDDAKYVWHIKNPTWSRLNSWWGNIWDQGAYDGVAWAIDSTYQDPESPIRGCKRNAINSPNFNPDHTRNRSPNTHYVTRTDSWETTEI